MNIAFSIVIPLFNKQNSIKKTIESVLNQTHQNFELLIINDGSTDKSIEIVSAVNDSRIKIINKKNGGVSSARNVGIINAKYNYVAFLDGDDLWQHNYLFEMNNLINDFPGNVIYGCNYKIKINDILTKPRNYLIENFRGILKNYYKIAQKNWLFHSSAIIIYKPQNENQILFDENISMGEDFDYWFRIVENHDVVFHNSSLVIYNNDGPNRAMERKHSITKNYIFHSEKFKSLEVSNDDFNKLINSLRIKKLPEFFITTEAEDKHLIKILKMIDYRFQSTQKKIFSYLPFFLKKIVIKKRYKKSFE